MKKFLFLLFVLNLTSCSVKTIPLKGNYPQTPIIYISDHSEKEVWDKLVDFFAQSGYSIKIIDKSSGLIVANRTIIPATYENRKGQIIYDTALVVLTHTSVQEEYSNILKHPNTITGDWNVRIKSMEGKTSININLVNLQQETLATYGYSISWASVNGHTTGRFEKSLYETIK